MFYVQIVTQVSFEKRKNFIAQCCLKYGPNVYIIVLPYMCAILLSGSNWLGHCIAEIIIG